MGKKILITGANGAFGLLTAQALLEAGHHVAATLREPQGRNASVTKTLRDAGAIVVEIDVTDDASVAQGTATAIEALNGLDVLINIAGTGTHGLTEGFSAEQMLSLFDINVVGVHRMIRGVLPTLRAQGAGLVINVSSLLGRLSLPFYGPYSATKWAVESLSDTYRAELSQYGVDFILVEPGGFATSWIDNLVLPQDRERLEQYGDFSHAPAQALKGYEALLATRPDQDPANVAKTILSLVQAPDGTRQARTTVDCLGMGEHVERMNETLAQVTAGIYQAFGTEDLLKLKVR